MRKSAGPRDSAEYYDPGNTVYAEQLRLLTRDRVDLPAHLLIAALVTVAFWSFYPAWAPPVWLGLFSIVIVARYDLQRRFRRAPAIVQAAPIWGRWLTLAALVTGCLWGATSSVFLVTPDLIHQFLIICVICGMMAAGMVGNAPFKPVMVAFVGPVIVMPVAVLISRPDLTHIEMGAMLAVLATVLVGAGWNIHGSMAENFRLQIDLAGSEAALANAQSVARVGSWEFDSVAQRVIWSAETYHILGFDPADGPPPNAELLARIHPEDRTAAARSSSEWSLKGIDFATDYRIGMENGSWKWVHEFSQTSRDSQGRVTRRTGIVQDITERKLAENKLEFANILLRTQMDASRDGIVVMDELRTIVSFNHKFCDMWDIPIADLTPGNFREVLSRVASSIAVPNIYMEGLDYFYETAGEDGHSSIVTTDGRSVYHYTVTLNAPNGLNLGRAWFFQDVTEHKRALAQAVRMARFDELTGLVNRSVFGETLRHAIANTKRGAKTFAVLYLDLDHFKDVNDTLGHAVGDELLKLVAERLRSNTRETDTVARFGGDEFAIVATDIQESSDAMFLANKLIAIIGEPFVVRGNQIHTGVSIGIDIFGPESSDAESLLSHADLALYRAKEEGRCGVSLFAPSMESQVRTRVALGAELHAAIAEDQLFLLYQPQIEVLTGRIIGVEALVRWRHPEHGVLGPGLFIPLAEQAGVIGKLGQWVLATACRQAKAWNDAGAPPIRMAVNVSSLQFKTPYALEANIAAALAENELSPEWIELELTETVLMEASREHADVLLRLREIGVTIAIDDFGTGYSSLDYLRRFPVNRIKIAQIFVHDLEGTPGNAAIVKATIGLARELGIWVIAEGVERREQLELLTTWGCGEVQGFYCAGPLPPENVQALLLSGARIHVQGEHRASWR